MTIAACVVAAVSMNGQLLYKISGNGLEKPSYIIGTHHLANVGFVEKIAGVKQALTDVDQVYGELKWDALTNTDSLKVLQEARQNGRRDRRRQLGAAGSHDAARWQDLEAGADG